MGVSPSYFRGRALITTVLPSGENGVVRHVTSSQWTPEDRALMLAWRSYQDTLCSGCGHPISKAWHEDNSGWYEAEAVTCQACTAREEAANGNSAKPVEFYRILDTRDYEKKPLPPWDGVT